MTASPVAIVEADKVGAMLGTLFSNLHRPMLRETWRYWVATAGEQVSTCVPERLS